MIKLLVSQNPRLVDEPDDCGRTALHCAVLRNDHEMVKELLTHAANPSIKDKKGYIALDYAISNRNIAIAEILFGYIDDIIYSGLTKDMILKIMSKFTYDLDSNKNFKNKKLL